MEAWAISPSEPLKHIEHREHPRTLEHQGRWVYGAACPAHLDGTREATGELGFIRRANGATGPTHYILMLNPFRVIKQHVDAGRVSPAFQNALTERMIEIGAGDLDDDEDDDEGDEED